MFASCLIYVCSASVKEIARSMLKSPRAVAKGMWSIMLNMVSNAKMLNVEGLTKLINYIRSFHSFKETSYSLHSKFQLNYKDYS